MVVTTTVTYKDESDLEEEEGNDREKKIGKSKEERIREALISGRNISNDVGSHHDGTPKNLDPENIDWIQDILTCGAGSECKSKEKALEDNERCALCGWCIHEQCGIPLKKYKETVIKREFSKVCLGCVERHNWTRLIRNKGGKNPHISTQVIEVRKNINMKTGTIILQKAVEEPEDTSTENDESSSSNGESNISTSAKDEFEDNNEKGSHDEEKNDVTNNKDDKVDMEEDDATTEAGKSNKFKSKKKNVEEIQTTTIMDVQLNLEACDDKADISQQVTKACGTAKKFLSKVQKMEPSFKL